MSSSNGSYFPPSDPFFGQQAPTNPFLYPPPLAEQQQQQQPEQQLEFAPPRNQLGDLQILELIHSFWQSQHDDLVQGNVDYERPDLPLARIRLMVKEDEYSGVRLLL